MTRDDIRRLAEEWIAAWNGHRELASEETEEIIAEIQRLETLTGDGNDDGLGI